MQNLSTEDILDYPVVLQNELECIEAIADWVETGSTPMSFYCANPHSIYEASKNENFRSALLSADLLTPDGTGIVLASKILGGNIRKRITGSDIFFGLNKYLNNRQKVGCFFLGSTDTTLRKIRSKMAIDYPDIKVSGVYSPPFKPEFDEADNEAMVEAINASGADILWVGMTAPKQEQWIHANKNKLNVKFVGAVGAVFDFYVGNVKRSHPFFQTVGLEWLPRLVQEPRRLWRRNFVSSPMFLLQVLQRKLVG